jgi:hypothetical protein
VRAGGASARRITRARRNSINKRSLPRVNRSCDRVIYTIGATDDTASDGAGVDVLDDNSEAATSCKLAW